MIKHLTPRADKEIQENFSRCSLRELLTLSFGIHNKTDIEYYLNKKLHTIEIININSLIDWLPHFDGNGPENNGRGLVNRGTLKTIYTLDCIIETTKLHRLLELLNHATKEVSILSYDLKSRILKIKFSIDID